jgi:hypothetical protein
MILRKPYAFLIKYFRFINLGLLVLSGYVAYKITPIVSFFRSYVSNNYSAIISANFSSNFINIFLYFAIIIIIIALIAIIYLFVYKKKPVRFYIFYLIYYILLLIMIFVWSSIFTTLESNTLATDSARLIQDVSLIVYIPQFAFIIVSGTRTLGFNVKQFNFQNDVDDLKVSSNDNEEVEINIGLDTYKTKRNFRRFIREFKYYVLENKLIVSIIFLVLVGLFIKNVVTNSTSYNKTYGVGDTFTYKNLQLTINDSIITNLDKGGNTFANDKYFLLINITVANKTNKGIDFDYNNLKLYTGQKHINPSLDLGVNFIDYGYPYTDKTIEKQSSTKYVFVYEIDKSLINTRQEIKMSTGIVEKRNIYYATSNTIHINPLVISDVSLINSYNLNDEINLSQSYLLNSKIIINDYFIGNKYTYTYNSCSFGDCVEKKNIYSNYDGGKALLVINGTIDIDSNSAFYKSSRYGSDFLKNFASVEYVLDGTTYTSSVEVVTPTDFTSGFILKTNNSIINASNVNLLITIRNKQYKLILKTS